MFRRQLLSGQSANQEPYLSREFQDQYLFELWQREYQERALPHIGLLRWYFENYVSQSPGRIPFLGYGQIEGNHYENEGRFIIKLENLGEFSPGHLHSLMILWNPPQNLLQDALDFLTLDLGYVIGSLGIQNGYFDELETDEGVSAISFRILKRFHLDLSFEEFWNDFLRGIAHAYYSYPPDIQIEIGSFNIQYLDPLALWPTIYEEVMIDVPPDHFTQM